VITATNRDLESMVRAGTFRQDLYFRLNVVVMKAPRLRERASDILPLAQHFLQLQSDLYNEPLKKISRAVSDVLTCYAWPGNVRELANVMEHSHVLAMVKSWNSAISASPADQHGQAGFDGCTEPEDVERQTIAAALKRSNYNKALASRMLGINIQRLNRRIIRLGIQPAKH